MGYGNEFLIFYVQLAEMADVALFKKKIHCMLQRYKTR